MIDQNGNLYRIDTLEKFDELMNQETNKYATKLNLEIERVIAAIMQGDENDSGDIVFKVPILEVKLEDPELEDNVDLFIQIVNKHLAVERYL